MKGISLIACLLFTLLCYSQTVKIMTYNIRLDLASDGENRWDNRKELLAGQVQFYEPDFLGVQEALPGQMAYLLMQFNNHYAAIGVGRDDGKAMGEYSAIFYNSQRYKVLHENTFWLSETPQKPSRGWDAAYNRVCTYGLFEDKKTRQKLWVFNTHLDHVGIAARVKSVQLILEKIKEVNKTSLPFVVMGDFNLEPDSDAINTITKDLDDSRDVAKLVFGPEGTFNAFDCSKSVIKRIDYIFIPKKGINVVKYAVLSDSRDCRYPSDHLPVYVEILLQ